MYLFSNLTSEEIRNFVIQGVLIGFYLVLMFLFFFQKKTWPLAIYYLGCFVKDFAVLVLGLFLVNK